MKASKVKRDFVRGGRMSRAKGHAFERWCAQQFAKIYPGAKRHLEYQSSEAKGVDLDGTGAYRVQCKRGRRYASISAIKEVEICPIDGGVPVLVTKGDNEEPMVVLPFAHFLELIEQTA